jgi:hypothetical protein
MLPLIRIRDPSHARRCCKPVHVCHICTQCFLSTDFSICHPAVYTCHEPATGSLLPSRTTQCASSTQHRWQSSYPFTGCGPHQQQQHWQLPATAPAAVRLAAALQEWCCSLAVVTWCCLLSMPTCSSLTLRGIGTSRGYRYACGGCGSGVLGVLGLRRSWMHTLVVALSQLLCCGWW